MARAVTLRRPSRRPKRSPGGDKHEEARCSKDAVIQDTPQTGTHTLQGEGQPSTGYQEEEHDQLLGLAFATRRDRSPVVSPFGEGLLDIPHPQTLLSQKPKKITSSIQAVMMNFVVLLFDQ